MIFGIYHQTAAGDAGDKRYYFYFPDQSNICLKRIQFIDEYIDFDHHYYDYYYIIGCV